MTIVVKISFMYIYFYLCSLSFEVDHDLEESLKPNSSKNYYYKKKKIMYV